MEKKRIGNDHKVKLTVTRRSEPENLEDKKLSIFVWSDRDKIEITEFEVKDNQIEFIWHGNQQRYTGNYNITLYENYGEKSQNVVDSKGFMKLVAYSWDDGDCTCIEMEEEEEATPCPCALNVEVNIDEPNFTEPTNDYTELSNLPRINGVELKGDLTFEDLGIEEITTEELQEIWKQEEE